MCCSPGCDRRVLLVEHPQGDAGFGEESPCAVDQAAHCGEGSADRQ